MSPTELRARLAADKGRMRAESRALRASMKARLERQLQDPAFAPILERRARAKRNRRIAALVIILALLLLLLIDCEPEPAPPVVEGPTPDVVLDAPEPPAKKKRPLRRVPKPLDGSIDATERDGLDVDRPPGPPWLPAFRLQVAARSPRLAACFNGAEEPGAMRWTTLVHANSGRVSDSVIEPVFGGASVDRAQVACLLSVLQSPSYRLDEATSAAGGSEEPGDDAVARRVSIIFEF